MTTDTKLAEVMALADEYAEKKAAWAEVSERAKSERVTLESAVTGILDALEAAQADARRYRWLREDGVALGPTTETLIWYHRESLDAAIDAAISETQPSSNAIRPDDPSPGSWVKGEQP